MIVIPEIIRRVVLYMNLICQVFKNLTLKVIPRLFRGTFNQFIMTKVAYKTTSTIITLLGLTFWRSDSKTIIITVNVKQITNSNKIESKILLNAQVFTFWFVFWISIFGATFKLSFIYSGLFIVLRCKFFLIVIKKVTIEVKVAPNQRM